ncbi:unnamed protein product [Prunus brigantina]
MSIATMESDMIIYFDRIEKANVIHRKHKNTNMSSKSGENSTLTKALVAPAVVMLSRIELGWKNFGWRNIEEIYKLKAWNGIWNWLTSGTRSNKG